DPVAARPHPRVGRRAEAGRHAAGEPGERGGLRHRPRPHRRPVVGRDRAQLPGGGLTFVSEAGTGDGAGAVSDGDDILAEARTLIEGAQEKQIPVRLVGGLAIRVLTPGYPPRERDGQHLVLASVSAHRRALPDFPLTGGYEVYKTFNALYGQKQLYF